MGIKLQSNLEPISTVFFVILHTLVFTYICCYSNSSGKANYNYSLFLTITQHITSLIHCMGWTSNISRIPLYQVVLTIQYSINPYPTAFPYGNGMVLHFYQQQESSTTKTVHKVINKGLKMYV